jgi:hypothetical protein
MTFDKFNHKFRRINVDVFAGVAKSNEEPAFRFEAYPKNPLESEPNFGYKNANNEWMLELIACYSLRLFTIYDSGQTKLTAFLIFYLYKQNLQDICKYMLVVST